MILKIENFPIIQPNKYKNKTSVSRTFQKKLLLEVYKHLQKRFLNL